MEKDDPKIAIFSVPEIAVTVDPLRDKLNSITENHGWEKWTEIPHWFSTFSVDEKEKFHTFWTVAGHHVREQIGDDRFLVNILRCGLPMYTGDRRLLYRGENLDRLAAGRIGFCWTEKRSIAEMFASGLNATRSGGVLIESVFDSEAIISSPSNHSEYLGEFEYTVDPTSIQDWSVIKEFESSD